MSPTRYIALLTAAVVQVTAQVSGPPNKVIAAGGYHSLFLSSDGVLSSVGLNDFGQLGYGNPASKMTPVFVSEGVVSVASVGGSSHYIDTAGNLWSTGQNVFGQLGNGTYDNKGIPVLVAADVVRVFSGTQTTFYIKRDGSLWGMGNNSEGQIGDGSKSNRNTPVRLPDGAIEVAPGLNHTLLLKSDGSVWSVGNNEYGQLLDGTKTSRSNWAKVAENTIKIAAGLYHSMLLKPGGSLFVGGRADSGQLGLTSDSPVLTPVMVAQDVTQIYAAGAYSAYISSKKELFTTRFSGGFGVFSKIAEEVKDVAAGYEHLLWVSVTDAVWGVGNNRFGQLGIGSLVTPPSPVRIREVAAPRIPIIVKEPSDRVASPGLEVSFSVVSTSYDAAVYQWKKDGVAINGATDRTYSISKLQVGDAGKYSVLVRTGSGFSESRSAVLKVSELSASVPITYANSGGGVDTLYAFEGGKTAILLPHLDYDYELVQRVLGVMDFMWSRYQDATGREPPLYKHFNGKPTLAVCKTGNIGGAAVGYLGASGIETGKAHFDIIYNTLKQANWDNNFLVGYEFGRNFSSSGYSGKIDFSGLDFDTPNLFGASVYKPAILDWWSIQGVPESVWRWSESYADINEYIQHATDYILDPSARFENSILRNDFKAMSRGRKRPHNIIEGLIGILNEEYGLGFTNRFWREVEGLGGAASVQGAMDNFALACSRAARQDLSGIFEGQFKIGLSDGAKALAGRLPYRSEPVRLRRLPRKIPDNQRNRLIDPDFDQRPNLEWYVDQGFLPGVMPRIDGRNPKTSSNALRLDGAVVVAPGTGGEAIYRAFPVLSEVTPSTVRVSGWIKGANLTVEPYLALSPWAAVEVMVYSGELGNFVDFIPFSSVSGMRVDAPWSFDWIYFEQYGVRKTFGGFGSHTVPHVDVRVRTSGGAVWVSDLAVEEIPLNGASAVPTILRQLDDKTVRAGESVSLIFAVGSPDTVSYAWFKDDAPLGLGNGCTVSFPTIKSTDSGRYRVVAYTGGKEIGSRTAVVSVISPDQPQIISISPNLLVASGERARLGLVVTGSGPFSYQWFRGDSGNVSDPVNGAVGASLITSPLLQPTSYWAKVTDSGGKATNSPAIYVDVSALATLSASQVVVGGGLDNSSSVTVTNTISFQGSAPSKVSWAILAPPGWRFLASGGLEGEVKPVYKSGDILEWVWGGVVQGPIEFSYTLAAPPGSTAGASVISLVTVQQDGKEVQLLAKPDPLVVRSSSLHSADSNRDGRISLTELTRVIELYNYRSGTTRTGQYKPQAGTEDGFTPGP